MAGQSISAVLDALAWLRGTGLFSSVLLRGYNEAASQAHVWVRLSASRQTQDEATVRALLAPGPGRPTIMAADVEEYAGEGDAASPRDVYLYLDLHPSAVEGAKRRGGRPPFPGDPLLENYIFWRSLEVLRRDPSAYRKGMLELERRYAGRGRGKPGYYEFVPDSLWHTYRPHPQARELLAEAKRVWGQTCRTLSGLAAHLNEKGYRTLYGKIFTKASARRVAIAVELLRGSRRPPG